MERPDLKYLIGIANGDNKTMRDIVLLFAEQKEETQKGFSEALESENFESISAVAHKTKSSARIFGLNHLADKLDNLEKICKTDKDITLCRTIISEYALVTDQAVIFLNDYLKNLK